MFSFTLEEREEIYSIILEHLQKHVGRNGSLESDIFIHCLFKYVRNHGEEDTSICRCCVFDGFPLGHWGNFEEYTELFESLLSNTLRVFAEKLEWVERRPYEDEFKYCVTLDREPVRLRSPVLNEPEIDNDLLGSIILKHLKRAWYGGAYWYSSQRMSRSGMRNFGERWTTGRGCEYIYSNSKRRLRRYSIEKYIEERRLCLYCILNMKEYWDLRRRLEHEFSVVLKSLAESLPYLSLTRRSVHVSNPKDPQLDPKYDKTDLGEVLIYGCYSIGDGWVERYRKEAHKVNRNLAESLLLKILRTEGRNDGVARVYLLHLCSDLYITKANLKFDSKYEPLVRSYIKEQLASIWNSVYARNRDNIERFVTEGGTIHYKMKDLKDYQLTEFFE